MFVPFSQLAILNIWYCFLLIEKKTSSWSFPDPKTFFVGLPPSPLPQHISVLLIPIWQYLPVYLDEERNCAVNCQSLNHSLSFFECNALKCINFGCLVSMISWLYGIWNTPSMTSTYVAYVQLYNVVSRL